ncbi:hypothetical protein A2U01_0021608 [Trifolium medium]|uniref:Uncharacterized protein n=1 Tax=Trifolium medium TaxID=97028 RepID=A0A392NL22_9FABA|nr:hypothetical protein [Trifolium medium]
MRRDDRTVRCEHREFWWKSTGGFEISGGEGYASPRRFEREKLGRNELEQQVVGTVRREIIGPSVRHGGGVTEIEILISDTMEWEALDVVVRTWRVRTSGRQTDNGLKVEILFKEHYGGKYGMVIPERSG